MKQSIVVLSTLTALMSTASVAWACGGDGSFIMWLVLAPFMAIPYALFGTTVIAAQAREWFQRPWLGWLTASVGGWAAAAAGVASGCGVAVLGDSAQLASHAQTALVFSTPLVFTIAYLMWLHARRPVQYTE